MPLIIIPVDEAYILGVYQGSKGVRPNLDILLKYRQKTDEGKWSRLRTPKHIHWAVDILLKMYANEQQTRNFVDFLIAYWDKATPFYSEKERKQFLNVDSLLKEVNLESKIYAELSSKGEYSIKFLLLIAELLMVQEKTGSDSAHMFGDLLNSLKCHRDIFSIVSKATFNGRR
jgi:hypothetical protein